MKTCTVTESVRSVCGAPAVSTFLSRSGKEYHECVDHALHGRHLLTCRQPLPLCTICAGEFGLG